MVEDLERKRARIRTLKRECALCSDLPVEALRGYQEIAAALKAHGAHAERANIRAERDADAAAIGLDELGQPVALRDIKAGEVVAMDLAALIRLLASDLPHPRRNDG